jgi:Protein of unknown function (DUF4236)
MWRFRKSFSPLPGVRLTLSPSGISTSVGVGPFRVTAGPRGPHFTATVPGSGLSFRQPLTGGRVVDSPLPANVPAYTPQPDPVSRPLPAPEARMEQIESAGSAVLTTPGISEFRKLLDRARIEHADVVRELIPSRSAEQMAARNYSSWRDGWFLRRIRKTRFAQLAAMAEEATARRSELEQQESLARLGTQIELPDRLRATYSRFSDAFVRLSQSSRIWDTVSHRAINQFAERTLAARAIERKPVSFQLGCCNVIQSDWEVPHLENANGGDLYLFPLFVVYFAGEKSFALLEYKNVQFLFGTTRFHEEEAVPPDSQVVGRTWAKTNKDGSPDRRFKGNYEIPVAEYGKLVFRSETGLNEEYMISNATVCEAFAKEWSSLVQGLAEGA